VGGYFAGVGRAGAAVVVIPGNRSAVALAGKSPPLRAWTSTGLPSAPRPLQHSRQVILCPRTASPSTVADLTTDDALGVEPGQLARPAARPDELAVLVGDEERRIRRRVVVV